MADIFISYARKDRSTAQRLAGALEGRGWSVWWDPRLKAGEIWDAVIERELRAARSVVVLWSAASVNSRWVRKEARYGDTREMLVPALIEHTDIPFEFSDVHAEDLTDWRGDPDFQAIRDLVDALAVRLGPPSEERRRPDTEKRVDPKDLPDLAVFRDIDATWCPEMVVLPAGTFMMGSPETDEDALDREKPKHRVTIGARFAVGRYPVTFAEYDRFVEETGSESPDDESWGRGRRPVFNVSWEDAAAYVEWLSKEAGEAYRLLSEAEWEYACRAGTDTRYCFGDAITEEQANFDKKVGKTTEVGSYPANPWGLHDLHGNVWEWVADVWHENYEAAPDDGTAWTERGDQGRRDLRGGSWDDGPSSLRSAVRGKSYPGIRFDNLGFRLARTF